MHYLVTGHTGFKGSWLTLLLLSRGHRVSGLAAVDPPEGGLFKRAGLADQLACDFRLDIRDSEDTVAAVSAAAPDVVVHMAAQPLVRESYRKPRDTYEINAMGTLSMLEAVAATPSVRAHVVVTTDKVYRNIDQEAGYLETDPLGGADPYSASKAMADLLVQSWTRSFPGAPTATARAGNVIGGGDWSQDRLIPDLVRGLLSGMPVLIRNPKAIRPWQHVLEPLAGYIALAEHLLEDGAGFASAWNFGPADDDAWPVDRIADAICAAWGSGAKWVRDTADNPHEAGYLKLDSSKARTLLGWRPVLQTELALRWVTEWYLACRQGSDMQAFTLRQITEYQARLDH